MAVVNTLLPSIIDASKLTGPGGTDLEIVEMLAAMNTIVEDGVWLPSNGKTFHTTAIRAGLPEVYFTMINQGVLPSKSTVVNVTEPCAILEGLSETDVKLLDIEGENARTMRLIEDSAFFESMSQRLASTVLYGTPAQPEQFVGLAPRYSSLTAPNGVNILSAAGTGPNLTSIWLVNWSPRGVHFVYPKNTSAGFTVRDDGEDWSTQADGRRLKVYRTHMKWHCGLVVRDWRNAVRIANVNVTELIAQTGTQALTAPTSIIKLMARAINLIPRGAIGRRAFYCSREVASQLMIIALEKSSMAVTVQSALTQFGTEFQDLRFLGVPVRLVDAFIPETVVA